MSAWILTKNEESGWDHIPRDKIAQIVSVLATKPNFADDLQRCTPVDSFHTLFDLAWLVLLRETDPDTELWIAQTWLPLILSLFPNFGLFRFRSAHQAGAVIVLAMRSPHIFEQLVFHMQPDCEEYKWILHDSFKLLKQAHKKKHQSRFLEMLMSNGFLSKCSKARQEEILLDIAVWGYNSSMAQEKLEVKISVLNWLVFCSLSLLFLRRFLIESLVTIIAEYLHVKEFRIPTSWPNPGELYWLKALQIDLDDRKREVLLAQNRN